MGNSYIFLQRPQSPEGLLKHFFLVSVFEVGATTDEQISKAGHAHNNQHQNKVAGQPEQKRVTHVEVNDCEVDEHAEDKLKKYHVHEAQTKVGPPELPADGVLLFVFLHAACHEHEELVPLLPFYFFAY